MPYITNWPPRRAIAIAAASLSFLVAAAPASAFGGYSTPYQPYQQYQPSAPSSNSCAMPTSSSVFSALGDTANYALLPGGDFTSSSPAGWALSGASIVPGGEPWNVSGSANPQSLNIPAGAYAVTPTFCVSGLFPTWRFFAQAADAGWSAQLKVTALYQDIYGNSGQMTATTLPGGGFTSWQPTSTLPLGTQVPPGDAANVRFVFSSSSTGGAWNIDDVYVDPYAR